VCKREYGIIIVSQLGPHLAVLRNAAVDKTGTLDIRVSGEVPSLILDKMVDGVGRR
jgi:hypothetical protein